MNREQLARMLDHSVLKPEATERDVRAGAEVVREWRIGYYCVQPFWVGAAAQSLAGTDAGIAAVVGFPHGVDAPQIKARAAAIAVDDGAREIDMVQNVGALK